MDKIDVGEGSYRFDPDTFDPLALIDVNACCFTDEEKDIIREKMRQKFKEDNPHLFQD